MKGGFAKLEKEVLGKVEAVLNQVCSSSGAKDCWASEKVQCELFAVKEFVQEKRCELVGHALEAVHKVKNDFDNYIKNRYHPRIRVGRRSRPNPQFCRCSQTAQDIVNQKFIDGMLGEYLLDPSSVDSNPEMFDDTEINKINSRYLFLYSVMIIPCMAFISYGTFEITIGINTT